MRILVAGASGLIGQRLGIELVRRGHELVVFSRQPAGVRERLPFPCEVQQWNPIAGSLDDPGPLDGIVNLAGTPVAAGRWTEGIKEDIRASRVLGNRLLTELARQKACRWFVSASAIGFYGDRADERLEETSPRGLGFLADVCEAWERELFESRFAGRKVAVRVGIVLARQGGALERMLPIFLAGGAGPLGTGQQWMSWIHLDDIVGIFREAVENADLEGVINGTAPQPARNERFTRTLADTLRVFAILPAPALALRLALGEMAEVVLSGQQVIPRKLLDAGFSFAFPTLADALEDSVGELRDGVRLFETAQYLAYPRESVWPFFSSERNLEEITPDTLRFQVLGKSTADLGEGTLIDYRLNIRGVPTRWQTKILAWNPPVEFVDVQNKGPYRLWRHRHRFEPLGEGTLMTDTVHYQLPLGWLGRAVAGAYVAHDVRRIFEFRRQALYQRFPFTA